MPKRVQKELTQDDIKSFLVPDSFNKLPLQKVISFFKNVPLSEVNDTAADYNNIKTCLLNSGLDARNLFFHIFKERLLKAKEEFLSCCIAS